MDNMFNNNNFRPIGHYEAIFFVFYYELYIKDEETNTYIIPNHLENIYLNMLSPSHLPFFNRIFEVNRKAFYVKNQDY